MPKVFTNPRIEVVLLLTILIFAAGESVSFAQQGKMFELSPTDDAYVATDLNDPKDKHGLEKKNTGDLTFLKLSYAWETKGAERNKILTYAYLAFDLSMLSKDQISSAKLQMYMQNVNLTANARNVAVYLSTNSTWKESAITHRNAPSFVTEPVALTPVSAANKWYEWDLTNVVKDHAGSKLALVVLLEKILNKNEEGALFASKEADDPSLRPKLLIETTVIPPSIESDSGMLRLIGVIATSVGGGVAIVLYMRSRKKSAPRVSEDVGHESSSVTTTGADQQLTSTAEMPCPNCGRSVSKEFKVCPYCEHDLIQEKMKCQSCGKDISKDYRVCPYCGSKISP